MCNIESFEGMEERERKRLDKEERKILEVKRALELVKSRNFKELEKEFEPETELSLIHI